MNKTPLTTLFLTAHISQERYMQTHFRGTNPNQYPDLYVFNNNYVGAGSYNIFAGVYVAFIFGAAFFFDLIWPERHERKSIRIAWKITGALAVAIHLSAIITLTVITTKQRQYCKGVSDEVCDRLFSMAPKHVQEPMIYRNSARAIAALVFGWLGFISVTASCVLLYMGIYNAEYGPGPKSAHSQGREKAHWRANHDHSLEDPEAGPSDEVSEKDVPQEPEQVHHTPGQSATAGDGAGTPPYFTSAAEHPDCPPFREDPGVPAPQ